MSEKVALVTDVALKFLIPSPRKLMLSHQYYSFNNDLPQLDDKQKHLVRVIITRNKSPFMPPLLVYGPFGMGKTFTLSQAIIQLIKQGGSRILVCTRSNSGADVYLSEYLSPAVTTGEISATYLRLYTTKRNIRSISDVVLRYCRLKRGALRLPTLTEMNNCDVIITTDSMCMHLCNQPKLRPFTHIFIDEAAQLLECDILPPILLANKDTHIIMAGDTLQIAPNVFSKLARDHKFDVPLLERLHQLYKNQKLLREHTICFTNNYRSSQPIVDFLSENVYQKYKIHSPKQIPPHPARYSLYFAHVRGETKLNGPGTSYYNNDECHEVVEQVKWLKNNWPSQWNNFDPDDSICVIVPYSKQRQQIAKKLSENGLQGVDCQLVRNVQGKEYRVIVISLVRTLENCQAVYQRESQKEDFDESSLQFGFFSDIRILNTAFSRARSMIICVGDGRAMVKVGTNQSVLKDFIVRCIKCGTIQPSDARIQDFENCS